LFIILRFTAGFATSFAADRTPHSSALSGNLYGSQSASDLTGVAFDKLVAVRAVAEGLVNVIENDLLHNASGEMITQQNVEKLNKHFIVCHANLFPAFAARALAHRFAAFSAWAFFHLRHGQHMVPLA
jgi:hypothetical protein